MTDTNHDETEVSKMTEEAPVESSESWKLKGDEFYRSKLYSKAIEAYSNAITNQVGMNANFYSNRAASYLMIGSYQEALKDCDTAVNIEPNSPKIYFRRATILKSLGRFDDSIKSLTDGLALDATSATAKTELDSLNLLKKQIVGLHSKVSNKQYRAVLPEIDAVIRIAGSRVRELNLLKARVLIELQRAPEAYNLTNAMMREHGSNADSELIVLRARCLYISGDLENAIKHLQQSLRLDPDCKSSRDFLKKTREIEEKKEAGNAAFKAAAYQISIDLWTESINLDNQNKAVTTKVIKALLSQLLFFFQRTDECS
jgi:DnaJ homolog subfamily C member 7